MEPDPKLLEQLVRQKHQLEPAKQEDLPKIKKVRRVSEAMIKLMMQGGAGGP